MSNDDAQDLTDQRGDDEDGCQAAHQWPGGALDHAADVGRAGGAALLLIIIVALWAVSRSGIRRRA